MTTSKEFLILLACLIVAGTQSVVSGEEPASTEPATSSPPAVPVFANNYRVSGFISLPYAELNEPFETWYDHSNGSRSRTDYYGDLFKTYQFGPKSAPDASPDSQYGAMYQLLYVPANFRPSQKAQPLVKRILNQVEKMAVFNHEAKQPDRKQPAATGTRRACFSVQGSVGQTVAPQTVFPKLDDFVYSGTERCPSKGAEVHRRRQCELWTYSNSVGEKKNTYKFWLAREPASGEPIPVLYYMLGYDTLLGSHYDRYDIAYHNYRVNGALAEHFQLDTSSLQCRSMPGPGDDASDGEQRSHMILHNPIHEYVVEPHRYDHIDHQFDSFADKHQKSYTNESQHRKGWHNFLHNLRFINGKNRQLKHYKLAVNKFADNNMRDLSYLRGRRQTKRKGASNGGKPYEAVHKLRSATGELSYKLPDNWNWVVRGAVTPVKDQAVCGSCWSFGTSGTLEGAYFVKTGHLPVLSQQQMVDCSWAYGNNGCDGGEDFRAYEYIMKAGGIATEEDYGHYLGVDGKCHDSEVKKTVKISGFYNVTANDREALMHALINYGPVTVAIDASRPTFAFYSHGVYYDDKCNRSPDNLDHQVLVVGYTYLDNKFAWIVKNSWSSYWGNQGYIVMSAENNNCGVMDVPTVPIIELTP